MNAELSERDLGTIRQALLAAIANASEVLQSDLHPIMRQSYESDRREYEALFDRLEER